mgnify:CR=1 FL=1
MTLYSHRRVLREFSACNLLSQWRCATGPAGMGGNGKATFGYLEGVGAAEQAGARFGREGAFSLVCFEVQDQPLPGADDDGDGISDVADNCPFVSNPNQSNTDGADDGGDASDGLP